ncbi:hypothetical protein P3T86_14000 (plasmid) [Staphylococcus nepalensis]|nr:hypothetical protein [Staphylococcus nepalensis]WQL21592.1 hypothetical protein P3T86_14000 [Staphylococcus nepalensis]
MEKETLIDLIDLMVGLTPNEKRILINSEKRKVEFRYKMALTEKTDEMIG